MPWNMGFGFPSSKLNRVRVLVAGTATKDQNFIDETSSQARALFQPAIPHCPFRAGIEGESRYQRRGG